MAMITEGTLEVNGVSLYTRTFTPKDQPIKARVIYLNGLGDSVAQQLYTEFFTQLATRGIQTLGHDPRGWGRSVHRSSEQGSTGPTSVVIPETASFIRSHLPSPTPLFVMAYSMGALNALYLASTPAYSDITSSVRGWLFLSTHLDFVSPLLDVLSRLVAMPLSHVLPRVQTPSIFPAARFARGRDIVAEMERDPLWNMSCTFECTAEVYRRTVALRTPGRMRLNDGVRSLWMAHGTGDKQCSYDAAKAWFERQGTTLEDGEFKTYEGWYHQLHADVPETRDVFVRDVADWILARVEK